MNILVTGSNGQLGKSLQQLIKSRTADTHTFFFTDVKELDITDPSAIHQHVDENDIEMIINCAAYTAVDKAESDIEFCRLLNSLAPTYLAKEMHRVGGRLIHISTDYVFDGTSYRPLREEDTPNPQSVYGKTKLESERNIFAACPESIILRTAWLYSPYGRNFVKTMLQLGREREELNVVSDQIGSPTSAADLAAAIITIIDSEWVSGIYHYSNEGTCSWYDFTEMIFHMADIDTCHVNAIPSTAYPTPAHRPHYSVLDKTKIKNTYHIDIPWWADSLRVCLDELLHHC